MGQDGLVWRFDMKDLRLLVWLTQLGLSVAIPPACFILLAIWLRDSCGWGGWVLWVGIGIGLIVALNGFRTSLKALERVSRDKPGKEPPPISFNDHN